MKNINIPATEKLIRELKAESAMKGFYFKDYVVKVLEERKK